MAYVLKELLGSNEESVNESYFESKESVYELVDSSSNERNCDPDVDVLPPVVVGD